MTSYAAINANGAMIRLYLPKTHWDCLISMQAHGLDLDAFTKACDQRRRGIPKDNISISEFIEFAVCRLSEMHWQSLPDRTNVIQPVFKTLLANVLDKTEAFFRKSGDNPMRRYGPLASRRE
ncbi:hypothetical protein TRP8649_02320 [Pelagimonas phthalicica]|uniref:Uncharacterized protein n=2 Tax=Pelagimonas phthalicica TaxID=1037362 RepID=A0A238JCR7_9RHOB|nr:hypothetical protein TRP8649_02320 [Pelagimonas phthalicica]